MNELAEALEDVALELGEHPRAQTYWELAANLRWDLEDIQDDR